MALNNFAVSKRRGNQMAAEAIESDSHETSRTRILSNAILDLHSEAEVVEEVAKLWGEAQDKFLAIGRYLRRAKARFPGSFEKKIIAALPFGKNVAYQLRTVAEAVDSGRLPEDNLPRSYATAFLLVSLPESDYEEARKRDLVRATVTRPEVDAFKRELRAARAMHSDRRQVLSNERRSLRNEIERMQARLAEIEAEIGPEEDVHVIDGEVEPVGSELAGPRCKGN
jgi:hypothetical protein